MSNVPRRVLRSSSEQQPLVVSTRNKYHTISSSLHTSLAQTLSTQPAPKHEINIIPRGSNLPNLLPAELKLLHRKQIRLSHDAPKTLASISSKHLRNALAASLIFAQHEAGSAVCIGSAGWVITCAHCFGETKEEYITSPRTRWLLFYDGRAVQVECRVWDGKCDLALLKIIAIESYDASTTRGDNNGTSFPFVALSPRMPAVNTPIICIGQPGSEDLESTTNQKTNYDLVEVSRGSFRGIIPGVNPCDNSEIGTLKHDAWTYWGHSGAPLLKAMDGNLVGLHSSWDDKTGMRHGVPLVAIEGFLRDHGEVISGEFFGRLP
ncbi:hypothetical protein AJ78_03731 [Emergomyces pasteurianus Ep9510]|uniref:AT hook domain-containing protein family protein n=1 Tax=Emergomyces pasteurianus Ep9510 TaxID=1447872 RepID=A0A1J9PJH9_9EURO|nr:hypothetical protein AJ78_03731 [Emergomyces pasteurianus Ep9510]